MTNSKSIRIIGVCAAQGALLFPFRSQEIVANIEPRSVFHSKGEPQWKLNFEDIPFVRSLEEVKTSKIDLILGSPSCGHSSVFSYSRKKSLGKPGKMLLLICIFLVLRSSNRQYLCLRTSQNFWILSLSGNGNIIYPITNL